MLLEITIKNFAIIEEISLNFENGKNSHPISFPGLYQPRSGHVYSAEYGTAASVCQLRADLTDESLYGDGIRFECEAAGEKNKVERGYDL